MKRSFRMYLAILVLMLVPMSLKAQARQTATSSEVRYLTEKKSETGNAILEAIIPFAGNCQIKMCKASVPNAALRIAGIGLMFSGKAPTIGYALTLGSIGLGANNGYQNTVAYNTKLRGSMGLSLSRPADHSISVGLSLPTK